MTEGLQAPAYRWILANPVLVAGILAVLIPVMVAVARTSWTTDQGAHGPIVATTGLWLLWREWQNARPFSQPAQGWHVAVLFVPMLLLYLLTSVGKIVELEGFFMYFLLVLVLYSACGLKTLKIMWFPLVYMLFVFPPPETIVAIVTNSLKIALSDWTVKILHLVGYPIGSEGVSIRIAQYELLVADACSGLNSLISLSAISLFYIYLRHRAHPRYSLVLLMMVFPVAIFANFIRIMALVLLTFYGGEAVAQGFLHDFAGMTTFMTALLSIFFIDHLIGIVWPGLKTGSKAHAVA
jgi:exosortase